MLDGLVALELAPSPKLQIYLVPVGTKEVFVKLTVKGLHP